MPAESQGGKHPLPTLEAPVGKGREATARQRPPGP